MGLFSSKKKTVVDTSVVRVVEDNVVPNMLRDSLVQSTFEGRDLVPVITENVLNSQAIKFDRAYRYAERGDYYYGLPNASMLNNSPNTSVVQAAIEQDIGFPLEQLTYCKFAPLNHYHMGWQTLTEQYGYNRETNEITVLSGQIGHPVYLDYMTPTYNIEEVDSDELVDMGFEYTAYNVWGKVSTSGWTPERSAQTSASDLGLVRMEGSIPRWGKQELDGVEIHYIWEDDKKTRHRAMFMVDLSDNDPDADFFQASFSYVDTNENVTKEGYWTYQDNSGRHPTVDRLYNLNYSTPGTYFPFAIFRRGKVNRTADAYKDTQEYKSTAKLVKYFGMDYAEMGKSIHENPDIKDIEQAVMMMGVPITSQDQVDLDYLWRFWSRAEQTSAFKGNANAPWGLLGLYGIGQYVITIQDADFRIVLSYGGIQRLIKAGKIGKVGTYTNTSKKVELQTPAPTDLGLRRLINIGPKENINRIFRKQIDNSFYEEITVLNPYLRYDIYKGKGVVGGANDGRCLIPIDKELADDMGYLSKETLYHRSLHFVFNSRVTYKVKWYQTGFFKFVMTVVAIAITIWTGGAASFVNGLVAAIGAGLLATAVFFLKMLIRQLIFSAVFKLVVKELGAEVAFLAALVGAAYGIAKHQGWGMVADPTIGSRMLTVANGLVSGINANLQEAMASLQGAATGFAEYAESAMDELKKINEELDGPQLIDPLLFVDRMQPITVFGESPGDFYDRTIHSGNIGTQSYDYIQNYVDVSLKLPDFNDTMGDTLYG